MKRVFLIFVLFVTYTQIVAQSTTIGHAFVPGKHIGFDASNGVNPLFFRTNDINRMKINGILNYNVNTYAGARNGFVLIGISNNSITDGQNIYAANKGAFSLLHLNGEGSGFQEFGYRPWMRTGVTFTSNRDMAYVGHRKLSTTENEEDLTEMVIAWSDNAVGPAPGPDDMVFRFMGGNAGTTVSTNFQDNNDLDGLHVARFTGDGLMGLGNTFGVNATGMSVGYVRPQSLLHMSLDGTRTVWSQYTNGAIGQTDTDGLRIGVNRDNAYLFNQENSSMVFSTNELTTSLARERMRLTHIGAPGIPTTATNNSTRLGISLNPGNPLTQPRSLVHIGENVLPNPLFPAVTDGVRNWMDVGYLATFGTDNIYVGLKREGNDRQDAVIAWGDNQTLYEGDGPDNLRFIFASTQNPLTPSTPTAASDNGQEVARFTPACAGCPVNTGSLGIGNFGPTTGGGVGLPNPIGPGTAGYIGATLDVNGDARIRRVEEDSFLTQILVRDPLDSGRIHWRDASTLGGAFGGLCGSAASATLTQDTEVPMSSFNFIFSGQDLNASRIGIGVPGCTPGAKLDVLETMGDNQIAINGLNTAYISGFYTNFTPGVGVKGTMEVQTNECEALGIGGLFTANTNALNYGVAGLAIGEDQGAGCWANNFGGYLLAQSPNGTNIGVYAAAQINGPSDWAAYINGPGLIPGGVWNPSDAQLKTNVHQIQNATQSLMQLNPVSYDFIPSSAVQMNLPAGNQFGVIAQELGMVFPNLVKQIDVPTPINLGGSSHSIQGAASGTSQISVVNYDGLIPVLIAAFQEQTARINQLEAQLNDCCNRPRNGEAGQDESRPTGAVIQTKLENTDEPSLGQNIPNPFENMTRVPAYVPIRTAKAEILFYGNDGRILQTVSINDRGNVSVDVDATTLAAGVYSYTLFVDGKPVDTKRMVKR